jgi:uncharacterized protein (TIGR03086 family)
MADQRQAQQLYQTVAEEFTRRLENCPENKWQAQSPDQDWTARDVAVHVVEVQRGLLKQNMGTDLPAKLGKDESVLEQWRGTRDEMLAALADPAKAGQPVESMFTSKDFADLVYRMVCTDTLIHTWDFARATGQDERLDPEAVHQVFENLKGMGEGIRSPGWFAEAIPSAVDADLQTQLLNFAGREL